MFQEKLLLFRNKDPIFSGRDIIIVLLLFVVALLVRIPMVDEPRVVVMDEGLYVSYISHDLNGEPFFAPHPPLGRMVLGSLFFGEIPESSVKIRVPGDSFDDFPYHRVRLFNVFIGSLTVSAIYILARMFSLSPILAVLPAVFLIFDNLHVVESRLMLTDPMLWLAGIFGILAFLFSLREEGRKGLFFLVLSAFLFGCAFSIKWTGLAFGAVAGLWLFLFGWWKRALLLGLVIAVVYFSFFALYVSRFEEGYAGRKSVFDKVSYIQSLYFPSGGLSPLLKSIFNYNKTMYRINTDLDAVSAPDYGGPYRWPVAMANFPALVLPTGSIILSGNIFSWILALIAVLWAGIPLFSFRKKPVSGPILFLFIGYLLSFMPILLIGRNMYIYSYMTPLLFAYLLVPFMFPGWSGRKFFTYIVLAIIFLVIISFVFFSPWTYGFPGWLPERGFFGNTEI